MRLTGRRGGNWDNRAIANRNPKARHGLKWLGDDHRTSQKRLTNWRYKGISCFCIVKGLHSCTRHADPNAVLGHDYSGRPASVGPGPKVCAKREARPVEPGRREELCIGGRPAVISKARRSNQNGGVVANSRARRDAERRLGLGSRLVVYFLESSRLVLQWFDHVCASLISLWSLD